MLKPFFYLGSFVLDLVLGCCTRLYEGLKGGSSYIHPLTYEQIMRRWVPGHRNVKGRLKETLSVEPDLFNCCCWFTKQIHNDTHTAITLNTTGYKTVQETIKEGLRCTCSFRKVILSNQFQLLCYCCSIRMKWYCSLSRTTMISWLID